MHSEKELATSKMSSKKMTILKPFNRNCETTGLRILANPLYTKLCSKGRQINKCLQCGTLKQEFLRSSETIKSPWETFFIAI